MFDWIKENLVGILAAVGAAVVLFGPQIKNKLLDSEGTKDKPTTRHGCECCHPPEPIPERTKSEWCADVIEIRNYCEKRRLTQAVAACDTLISEIVSGKPVVETATVNVTKVSRG